MKQSHSLNPSLIGLVLDVLAEWTVWEFSAVNGVQGGVDKSQKFFRSSVWSGVHGNFCWWAGLGWLCVCVCIVVFFFSSCFPSRSGCVDTWTNSDYMQFFTT